MIDIFGFSTAGDVADGLLDSGDAADLTSWTGSECSGCILLDPLESSLGD